MPDGEVAAIRNLTYYQYAKIIAKSAFAASDGREAKGRHYGVITQTLRELGSGAVARSDCGWGDERN